MLQHAGNNFPLETLMYLLLLLFFGTALCYARCKYGPKTPSPRAYNFCRRMGMSMLLLHTCCCSMWDIQGQIWPHGVSQKRDVIVPGLQAHNSAKTRQKKSCFTVEEYEEHMFGQAGGQRCSSTSQGWLGSGMPIKTPPLFLLLPCGQEKTLISAHAIKTSGCHM